jgi:hypothetical protein
MTSAVRNVLPAERGAAERCQAFFAYQLGCLPRLFLSAAEALWYAAEEGDPFPPAPPAWVAHLGDLVDRLTPDDADLPARERHDRVRRAAGELLRGFRSAWDGPGHRDVMGLRDCPDPELLPAGFWDEAPPLVGPARDDFEAAVQAFVAGLAPAPGWWARLGSLVMGVLTPPLGSAEAVAALPVLQNELAARADEPLLVGLDLVLTPAVTPAGAGPLPSRDRVLVLHQQLEARLVGGTSPLEGRGEDGEAAAGLPPVRKGTLALALLIEHPEWPDVRIAAEVGCDRTTLFRNPKFRAARAMQRRERDRFPPGSKAAGRDGSPRLEAEDPHSSGAGGDDE